MFRYHHLHHGGWAVLGFAVHLLFWAAVIGLLAFLVLRLIHRPVPHDAMLSWRPPTDSALEQARFRYARGEISRDEYFRIGADLGGPRPFDAPPPPPAQPAGPPPPG